MEFCPDVVGDRWKKRDNYSREKLILKCFFIQNVEYSEPCRGRHEQYLESAYILFQNNPDTNISMALVFHDGHSPYITCFTIPKRVAMKHEAHAEKY